jgi:hypothetical protein
VRISQASIPRSTKTESVYACKRPYTFRISVYTTVFCRITWARITIVHLRVVYGNIRRKKRSFTAFVHEGRTRLPFCSVFCLYPIILLRTRPRKYTIVIRAHVIRQNTVVYREIRNVYGRLRTPFSSTWVTSVSNSRYPSRSEMYRTSAASDLHSVLHFAQKNKVYSVHFAEKIYTLILRPLKLYVSLFDI